MNLAENWVQISAAALGWSGFLFACFKWYVESQERRVAVDECSQALVLKDEADQMRVEAETAKKEADRFRRLAENQLMDQRQALHFTDFVPEWDQIRMEVCRVINDPKNRIDRFLMFRACNGEGDPKYTTAVCEIRAVDQIPMVFIEVPVDGDYLARLLRMVGESYYVFKTAETPRDADINGIYTSEGVTESFWGFMTTYSMIRPSAKALEYLSMATHHQEGFTPQDIVICKLLLGRIRALSESFVPRHELEGSVVGRLIEGSGWEDD